MNAFTHKDPISLIEQKAVFRLRLEEAGRIMNQARLALEQGDVAGAKQILDSDEAVDCMIWAGAINPPRPAIITPRSLKIPP